MSTLIERMIQRTRGPLSSLEPVATPAFAAVPLGEHAWAGSPGEAAADEASVVASGQDQRPGQRPDQQPGERPDQQPGTRQRRSPARTVGDDHADGPADSGRGPLLEAPVTARARPARAMPAPDPSPRNRTTPRWPEPPPAANRHLGHDHSESGPDQVAMPVGRSDENPHNARERAVPEPEANAAAGPEGRATAAGPRAAAAEPGARAAVEPATLPARLRRAHPQPEPPELPGQAAYASGSGPEITISIGHIEVRSAPATEQPRIRPPFRPQVSLADFLGQDRRP